MKNNNIKMAFSKIGFIVFLIFIFKIELFFAAALIPEPTQIIRTHVTTFSYGGFGQIQTIEQISKRSISSDRSTRFRRTAAQDSELFKNEPDPFSIPEVETYPVEDLKGSSNGGGGGGMGEDINQQDPRVQEVDVVGWFE